MNKDQVQGIIDEVAGTAKRKTGELTDNPKLELKGTIQLARGKAEGAWGKAKEAVHDSIKNSEVHLHTHVTLKTTSASTDAKYKK